MISKSGCMECGAPVLFEEFSPVASCTSCGAAHRLPRDASGAWLLTYASELMMEDARRRTLEIVGSKLGRSRRTRFELTEIFPIYLPVWKFVCHGTGWFRTRDGVVLPVNLQREMRLPAYENHAVIGTPHDIGGSDARISPDSHFPMLHVEIGLAALRKKAEESLIGEISSFGDIVEAGKAVKVNVRDAILALYPAWVVRFRTRNGEHSLTIDGITGQSMNVVDIPVTDEKRFSESFLAVTCGSLLSAGIGLSFIHGIHGLEIGLAVAGVSLFAMVNMLRLALRSSRLNPRPKGRKVSA